ncbi:MAG: hypothetical protein SFY80_11275 [Verrucomicrobiota bacterium]|nr:hypothetical protein [Verrucomicrobiota bacterium]
MLSITELAHGQAAGPLDLLTITGAATGSISVRDGKGREYFRAAGSESVRFKVGGALGQHWVFHSDAKGVLLETIMFTVTTKTAVTSDNPAHARLLHSLWWTMVNCIGGAQRQRVDGKVYRHYVSWLRDHTHTLKGMKWFDNEHQSGFELYADHQRADGMIWDKLDPFCDAQQWRDHTFREGGFIQKVDDGYGLKLRFERIPVENDVEYLFIECLYYTWKATGDTAWMLRYLDHCLKAVAYATTDPYRWSTKFNLLKRGYTIDTWDFKSHQDNAITQGWDNCVDIERTTFGVMHGDNTGMATSLNYLAEMLAVAGRSQESEKCRALSQELMKRLNTLAWNKEFFVHHVTEDTSFVRDLGVDESRQVSLSNAYALNRAITHEQAVAIIQTYQRIRGEMPETSPGEWYNIYPPFEKGFSNKWGYMNGGVCTIVAGELAHGAFEHGHEAYGADILKRLDDLAQRHGGHLDVCFLGKMDVPPAATFTPISLADVANVDFVCDGEPRPAGVMAWQGEVGNDLAQFPVGNQHFFDVPFTIADPASNGRRACLGLSTKPGYVTEALLPVWQKAQSIYFLHTIGGRGGNPAGSFTVLYDDGSEQTTYIRNEVNCGHWFMPEDYGAKRKGNGHAVVDPRGFFDFDLAWRGANKQFENVGAFIYGFTNPHPEKLIRSIRFEAARSGANWFVLGLTLSDQAVFLKQTDVSFGIPDGWGAAAVVYALVEGLAGMKDTGVAFDRALLAPRWPAAGVKQATATAKYEASGGYVTQNYHYDPSSGELRLEFTGSAQTIDIEVLLPDNTTVLSAVLDGSPVSLLEKTVEKSRYASTIVRQPGAHLLVMQLR